VNEAQTLRRSLAGLTAYRNLLALPVMEQITALLRYLESGEGEAALGAYCDGYYALEGAGSSSLSGYLEEHIRYDSAPFSEQAASGLASPALQGAAQRDVGTLSQLCQVTTDTWKAWLKAALPSDWAPVVDDLPGWDTQPALSTFPQLMDFYQQNGAGLFSKYRTFLWQDRKLHPVANPDYIPADELVGYTFQRDQVYANTAALVAGKSVNNVLLYGDSGTGKSATVKSLLGIPAFSSLRLIEMDKSELAGIPQLIRMLGHRPQKFILYIDDLAFDKDDQTYSLLKTILEGGLEPKPANVAIYATSNRRHLVRESFSDRAGDELDSAETIEEKTSLSERFGLRIPYLALNQEQFLNLTYELADRAGITLPREQLRAKAIRWMMRHPGRTPRVAQQLIHALSAEQK
jgi:predicted AAA+ superfamily ATPase